MDRGERGLSNGAVIMKIGRFNNIPRERQFFPVPRRVRTRIFHWEGLLGYGVTLFDSSSPEDSNTGRGFILPSKLLKIRPVLYKLYNNQLLVREMRTFSTVVSTANLEISVAIQPPFLPIRLANFRSYLKGRRI